MKGRNKRKWRSWVSTSQETMMTKSILTTRGRWQLRFSNRTWISSNPSANRVPCRWQIRKSRCCNKYRRNSVVLNPTVELPTKLNYMRTGKTSFRDNLTMRHSSTVKRSKPTRIWFFLMTRSWKLSAGKATGRPIHRRRWRPNPQSPYARL